MTSRSPYDVPAANECATCQGRGYTYDTAQLGKQTPQGFVTTDIGYGCLNCLGVGRTSYASDEALVDE